MTHMSSAIVSDLHAVLRGAFVHNRMRTLAAVAAIALGVALGLAVQLVNASAVGELAQGVRMLSGDADLSIRGGRDGFDESLYALVARDAEVAVASPVVEVDVAVGGEGLRIAGIDPFPAGAIQPGIVGETDDRLDAIRPDTVFLSNAARHALGVHPGDTIVARSPLRDVTLRVAGGLAAGAGMRIGTMDIAAAQEAFGQVGVLTRIDLRLRPGVDVAAFAKRISALLPPGVLVDRPAATLRATERISRSYRINLNVLALVALFTGALLVFTTQALSTVRRRTSFALLRTLGMTRRRLAVLCAFEGASIGIAGSIAGLAIGYGVARVALRMFGPDLGSGYFRGVEANVVAEPAAFALFFALGVVAAVAGSIVPAREAARASPARALKAGDEETVLDALRPPGRGFAVLLLGMALVALPPVDDIPVAGYAAIACLLIGTLLLLPWIAHALLSRAPTPASTPAELAIAQLRGAPGQASVSLATIVASVSLMVSMAIMVASFRQSLDDWLGRVLPASMYARVPGAAVAFDADARAVVARIPGVTRVEAVREEQLLLDASRPRVVLLARPIDETQAASVLPLTAAPVQRPADAPPPLWANEAMVDLYGFSPGRIVTLPIAGREARFFVAGVWRDYGRPHGAVQIDLSTYGDLTGDARATTLALWLDEQADRDDVSEAMRGMLPAGKRLDIQSSGDIRRASLAAFDRTFAVTYALELAGIVIGLVGLSSAVGALVLARRREFGMLTHVGMTRRQIAAMLACEGFAMASIGTIVGTLLGAMMSLVLIYVVNRQSFHWGMEVHLPLADLALFAVAIVALATLTAVVSGRHATSVDAVRAVREDW